MAIFICSITIIIMRAEMPHIVSYGGGSLVATDTSPHFFIYGGAKCQKSRVIQ